MHPFWVKWIPLASHGRVSRVAHVGAFGVQCLRFLFSRIPFARIPGVLGVCSRTNFFEVTHLRMSPLNTFKQVRIRSSLACGTLRIMFGSKANFLKWTCCEGFSRRSTPMTTSGGLIHHWIEFCVYYISIVYSTSLCYSSMSMMRKEHEGNASLTLS